MDNRERGRRDASLGFGTSLQMMNRLSAVLPPNEPAAARVRPSVEEPTKRPLSEPEPPDQQTWIRATASCTIPVFDRDDDTLPSQISIDEGSSLRMFLPIQNKGGDQWAKVQFISTGLGDLATGWARVADADDYFVENLSV